MMKSIVLLSGGVLSGKSTLAEMLKTECGYSVLKTWELLKKVHKDNMTRESLQRLGDEIEWGTMGAWVRDEVIRFINDTKCDKLVVDAVRTPNQIKYIYAEFGEIVKHIHLEADIVELKKRHGLRQRHDFVEPMDYAQLLNNETERDVPKLGTIADIQIKTDRCTKQDVLVRAMGRLGYNKLANEKLIDVLIGGEYGSEGKGQIAAYLSQEYDLLIRVGGPNAGHKVYEEPEPYTFHILPSGSRISKAKLMLGPGTVISVQRLMKEIDDCNIKADRLSIDPQAVIIEEVDILNEQAIVKSIGSTGQGVGAATTRRIWRGTNGDVRLARDINALKPYIRETWKVLADVLRNKKRVLLEGTQGTGLSLYHGHYPHVTSRDTTVAGCLSESGIAPHHIRKTIMVCRTFPIRVQSPDNSTSGFMSSEITLEEVSQRSGIALAELQKTETTSTTKRKRRISEFDWQLLQKSSFLNAPTDIALTFVDYISASNKDARRFDQLTPETIQFIQEVECVSNARVSLIATRFHTKSIIDRRVW